MTRKERNAQRERFTLFKHYNLSVVAQANHNVGLHVETRGFSEQLIFNYPVSLSVVPNTFYYFFSPQIL